MMATIFWLGVLLFSIFAVLFMCTKMPPPEPYPGYHKKKRREDELIAEGRLRALKQMMALVERWRERDDGEKDARYIPVDNYADGLEEYINNLSTEREG